MKVINNFKRVEPKTPKSQKFRCNFCENTFFCINYKKIDGVIYNICNYNFCPYCGNELFIFKKNKKKEMKQPEKCKINKNSVCLYPIEECDNCPNNTEGEKMELIIEISEKDYINIYLNGLENNKLFNLIRNGEPLTKKHGRLIDLDELFKTLNSEKKPVIEDINYILRHAPVIIDAADQEEKKHDRRTNDT